MENSISMRKIFVKTTFSAPHEIKYLKLQLRELYNYIDGFIICECNRTHIGTKRELIFTKYLDQFDAHLEKKIIYLPIDLSGRVMFSETDPNIIHNKNEKMIRGCFINEMNLDDQDIIVSVDADEIIFGRELPNIIRKINIFRPAVQLRLYQFFYKINYLWKNKEFIAPTVCYVKYYKNIFPANWRYDGKVLSGYHGCHFSWCMSIKEMITKLSYYGHHNDYGHLADEKILNDAVTHKTYPFNEKELFNIEVLDILKSKEMYPEEIYYLMDEYMNLIGS